MRYWVKGGLALSVLGFAIAGLSLYFSTSHTTTWGSSISLTRAAGYVSQIEKSQLNLGVRTVERAGAKLIFKPRKDTAPWPLQLPLDWSADPFKDNNWTFQVHAWRMIDPLLHEYFNTGNKERLHEAFGYALDWFNYHYESRKQSTMAWYDMAAGFRAMKLAFFLDQFYAGTLELSPEDTRSLAALVDEHAGRLQDESFISMGNHGLFQVFGLDLLCQIGANREPCIHGREFASRMFSKILSGQFTDQGVHREHSPFYHRFVRRTIEELGGAKRFNDERTTTLLSKAAEVEPWLIDPSGQFVAVGDTEGHGQPLAVQDGSAPAVGDFSKSGYAIVRDKDSMLFVMGMAHTDAHKHADDLSFVLFEHGRPLFVDTGKYGYNDDSMRDYVESAAAHNTISLMDQRIKPANLVLTGSQLDPISSNDGRFGISGKIERPGLFKQRREIQYQPGQTLVVRDEVSSDRERQFVSSLHLARDLAPELVDGGFDVALRPGTRIKARLVETDCTIETVRGQTDPTLGWESVGYLKMEPASVVRAICPGRSRTITWTVALQ